MYTEEDWARVGIDGIANFTGTYEAGTYTLYYGNSYSYWDEATRTYISTKAPVTNQYLGGWFGDIGAMPSISKIQTFGLAPGAHVVQQFPLVTPSFIKVTVTPTDYTDYNEVRDETGNLISRTRTIDTSTWAAASLIFKTPNGATALANIPVIDSIPYTPTAAGVWYIPTVSGQKYYVRGSGYTERYAYEWNRLVDTDYYETQWYGGYTGDAIVGNPTNLKAVTGPAVGVTDIGTIALKPATGVIQGTTALTNQGVSAVNIATGEDGNFQRTQGIIGYNPDGSAQWGPTLGYTIKGLKKGVYAVSSGGTVNIVSVAGTVTQNFGYPIPEVNTGRVDTQFTGEKVKGKKIVAKATAYNAGLGVTPTFKYFWTDGAKILSKKNTYKVAKNYVNKNLYVVTVATASKYSDYTITGAPGNTLGTPAVQVAVTGTYKTGKKLTAKATTTNVNGAKYKYQWYRGNKKIAKATKKTYKLTKADKKKKVYVVVTATKKGWSDASVKSPAKKVK
ncbi:MAG: hypothetical protein LBG82_00095 [Clostridiales Family XIII bacterium]|nr:hypothetical protein [Clostridiales Family XIII bacterium]